MMLSYTRLFRVCMCLVVMLLFSTGSFAATRVPKTKLSIRIGGGWSKYSMSAMNDYYIDEFAKEVDLYDDNIDNGPHIFGEIACYVMPNVSASFGFSYLRTKIEKDHEIVMTDERGERLPVDELETFELTATVIAPEAKIRYHLPFSFDGAYLGGGLALCFGRVTNVTYKLAASGLGIQAFGGVSFDIRSSVSLGAEIGYRYFRRGRWRRMGRRLDHNPTRNQSRIQRSICIFDIKH